MQIWIFMGQHASQRLKIPGSNVKVKAGFQTSMILLRPLFLSSRFRSISASESRLLTGENSFKEMGISISVSNLSSYRAGFYGD